MSTPTVHDAASPEPELPEIDLSEKRVGELLSDIKRNSRNRRLAMIAPIALATAVLAAMVAAPPQHGGLALVPDADAASELPRVFGSNGVWRLAEPITDAPQTDRGPAAVVEAATAPSSPLFVLTPPDQEDLASLPASTSTPPTSTLGQSPDGSVAAGVLAETGELDPADLDWSDFTAIIRIEAEEVDAPIEAEQQASADASPQASISPDSSVTAEDTTTPELSSQDEDVSVNGTLQDDQLAEANPSTPPVSTSDAESLPSSADATIVQRSVLVYDSAHVSVTVQVVDDDSSVIDWCNTRVDWGDGSVTGVLGADGVAMCTASCEYEATPSDAELLDSEVGYASDGEAANGEASLDELIKFDHEYSVAIDASPRIFVATGDGCSYTLAELQLSPFSVIPDRP